jgi:hypothetical protein
MIVDVWAKTFWTVLNVRKKTLFGYKALYRRHLQPVIGQLELMMFHQLSLTPDLIILDQLSKCIVLFFFDLIYEE